MRLTVKGLAFGAAKVRGKWIGKMTWRSGATGDWWRRANSEWLAHQMAEWVSWISAALETRIGGSRAAEIGGLGCGGARGDDRWIDCG